MVRERRNTRLRAFLSSLTRSGGPVRYWALGLIIAAIGASAYAWHAFSRPTSGPPVISYSELSRALNAGAVKSVRVEDGGARLTAEMRSPARVGNAVTSVVTAVVTTRAV